MAKQSLTGYDASNQRVVNVASPSSSTDATNKNYVDNLVSGLSWKLDVRAATTGNGTLASAYANGSVIDSVTLATGDRVLIKNQSTQSENGIYIVNVSGAPTRAADADTTAELNNATVSVLDGSVNTGLSYTQTTKNPTIGSSNIVWGLYAAGQTYTASTGLTAVGNDFRLASSAAGTGLSYAAGVLSVDRTKVPNVFNADVGDGSTLALPVTHNLNTKSVTYTIRRKSDDVFVDADVVATSVNVLTITFAVAPTTNQYNITVVG